MLEGILIEDNLIKYVHDITRFTTFNKKILQMKSLCLVLNMILKMTIASKIFSYKN